MPNSVRKVLTIYEAVEEQRDDEVRTLQVPERSEGKTKVIK